MVYMAIIFSAILHTSWNGIVHKSECKLATLACIRAFGMIIGIIIIMTQSSIQTIEMPFILLGVLLHYLYFFLLINGYKHGDFSMVYPVARGVAPVLIFFIGVLLGEKILVNQLISVTLVSVGILGIVTFRSNFQLKPLIYALLISILISAYTFVGSIGVNLVDGFLLYVAWMEFLTGLGIVLAALVVGPASVWQHLVEQKLEISFAGLSSLLCYSIILWSLTKLSAASVAAIREVGIVFSVLVGWIYFKEKVTTQRLIASIIVFVGIILLMSDWAKPL